MRKSRRIRTSEAVQQRARELRRQQTPAESLLWEHLRRKQLKGLKFRRQHPIGRFIVDFYCAAHQLVIELDGGIHQGQSDYDSVRTEALEAHGYHVLCFSNERVTTELEEVLAEIAEQCASEGGSRE